ncbi:MAG: fliK, partial [Candidatus Brocadiaceae bacterium]|nr:fliK [Candidatus Brocadiaceae bacterium]
NAQSNVPDFQQNTKTSPYIGTPLSSSIEDAKTVNHMFRSNDMSNVGHTHENIMEQIFEKIRITTHGDRSEIKLSLNPPELGNVKIHFTEEGDEIEAKIFVENAEVKAAIENNVHRLKESVATNGIEIHKLEIYIQNNDANKQESIENFNANNPHHQNHTFSQNGFNEDHAGNEENMNDKQIEIRRNTSNLMVDYLI